MNATMENQPINVLVIEESKSFIDLITRQLDQLDENFKIDSLKTEQEIIKYLRKNSPQLVICDYEMPGFSGRDVLAILKDQDKNPPVILISEHLAENEALEAMMEGASDYVLKNNLSRLSPIIKREILRYQEHLEANEKLYDSENRFKYLVQTINGIVREFNLLSKRFAYVSPQTERILGYQMHEWVNEEDFLENRLYPEDREEVIDYLETALKVGGNHTLEYRIFKADGSYIWIRDLITIIEKNGIPVALYGLMIDITEQKVAEQLRDDALRSLKKSNKEQKCLYNISNLSNYDYTIPQLLQKAVMYISVGFQYPDLTEVLIEYGGEMYHTENYVETEWAISGVNENIKGGPLKINVVYLETKEEMGEYPFLDEERLLIDTLVDNLSLIITRINAQEDIKMKQELLKDTYQLAKLGRML